MGSFFSWVRLMRWHQPVGVYLVMWPALIGLFNAAFLATGATPPLWMILAFVIGAALSRAAGCIANDIWDRDIDPTVERTKDRPLASGEIRPVAALMMMLLLFVICAYIAWSINLSVLFIATFAVPCILLYPLAKRVVGHPQVVLSFTFSLGIPMAYASQNMLFSTIWLPLFFANMTWIYAYDTVYAMADKPDDAKLGIGSSALRWGKHDWLAVAVFQAITWILLIWWWWNSGHGILVAAALVLLVPGFIAQQRYIKKRSISRCILAFKSNHWLQATILLALLAEYMWANAI